MSTVEALRGLRARAGLSMAEAAGRMGLKRASSYQYYESETGYGRDRLPPHFVGKLKEAFVGLGSPPITVEEVDALDGAPERVAPPAGEIQFATTSQADKSIIRDMLRTAYGLDFIRVPLFHMAVHDEASAFMRGLNSVAAHYIAVNWFSMGPGRPREDGAFIVAASDAMSPTINPGDTVFVDRTVKEAGCEGIYVIAFGSFPVLRRMIRNPKTGAPILSADNHLYGSAQDENGNEPTVIGRVTWTGRDL